MLETGNDPNPNWPVYSRGESHEYSYTARYNKRFEQNTREIRERAISFRSCVFGRRIWDGARG